MNEASVADATFEARGAERALVGGVLDFATVTKLLPAGTAAIDSGQASVIDLGGVTSIDSAGLALLIEWLSVAHAAQKSLHYENIPPQLLQLARLSEVDELITAP